MEQLTDKQILKGLLTDNNLIIERIYKKYGPDILGYILKNGGSEKEGLEVLQLTIIKVWEKVKAGAYQDRGRFRQWFFQIAVNFWRMKKRGEQKNPITYCGEWEDNIADQGEEDRLWRIWRNKYTDFVCQAIPLLGEKCQRYIQSYHFEERKQVEIARAEGMNHGAFRKALHACRKKLETIIGRLMNESSKTMP